jgi:S1-C subfamily serine protease
MARLLSYTLIFLLGFTACAVIVNRLPPYQGASSADPARASLATYRANPLPITGGRYTVADAVARVGPAVVSIFTSGRSPLNDTWDQLWLRRWFGRPLPRRDDSPIHGVASGVIIGPEGYVLTNNHVVEDADRMTVTLSDGRRFDGQVLGADPEDDLAVVKIDGSHLPTAQMGDSARLRKGEWVIAIGNPLGFDSTVTVGVVSAERSGRPFPVEGRTLRHVIQTDAAINQGNSGGALVNLNGELIGINTAIVSTSASGGSIGIGFAIPVNDARPVVKELIAYGRVLRPWIGIRYVTADAQTPPDEPPDGLWGLGARGVQEQGSGVVVQEVLRESPAAQAGIRAGDVIRRMDSTPVGGSEDVYSFMARHSPGQHVRLLFRRNGRTAAVTLRLGQKPPDAGMLFRR